MIASGTAFVGVATPALIYVVISDKELFDAINLPVQKYQKLLCKTEQLGDITVIIQYWLPEVAIPQANR